MDRLRCSWYALGSPSLLAQTGTDDLLFRSLTVYAGYTCSVDCDQVDFGNCPETGTCLLAASQAARFRKARRSEVDVKTENLQMMLRRAASVVAQPGDELAA